MKNRHKILCSLCLLFFLFSCGVQALYHGLSEGEANSILVILQENGIGASKIEEVKQNEVVWSIEVKKEDLSRAHAILVANNLPRKEELGLTGVYKEKGLIPTPDEQKARFLLALKGEIINSLEKLPEVIDADVVLNVPTQDEFIKGEKKHPTASVVVKAKAPELGENAIGELKIQQFVANSVEGMAARNVSVLISYVDPIGQLINTSEARILSNVGSAGVVSMGENKTISSSQIAGLTVSPESKNRLKIYLILFFGILLVLAVALVVTIIQASRFRQEIAGLRGKESQKALEGEVLEGSERGRLGPGARS